MSNIPESVFFEYPVPCSVLPPARWAHSAVAVRSCLFVYGGIGQSVLDDLWVLDSRTLSWRLLPTTFASQKDRPSKLFGHSAAAAMNKLWIFGGQQGRKFSRELYSLDLSSSCWKFHPSSTPPKARAGHRMVAVSPYGQHPALYMFGGQGKRLFNDLWRFTPSTMTWAQLSPKGDIPLPRHGHSLVWDGADTLLCFGGSTGASTDNTLYAYSISRNAWSVAQSYGTIPSSRLQHTAVLVGQDCMLVYGGCSSQGLFFNDVYVLDVHTYVWSKPELLNSSPPARYHHTCCVLDSKLVVYGGINSKQTFDTVVVFDLKYKHELLEVAKTLADMTGAPSREGQADENLMKYKITDLLVKRNLQEAQHQAVQKAVHVEGKLAEEQQTSNALLKELGQCRLVYEESEQKRLDALSKTAELERKLINETALCADLKDELHSVRVQQADQEHRVAELESLLSSLVKELGILSSRYSKLQRSLGNKVVQKVLVEETRSRDDFADQPTSSCSSFSDPDSELRDGALTHNDSTQLDTTVNYELLGLLGTLQSKREELQQTVEDLREQVQTAQFESMEAKFELRKLQAHPETLSQLTLIDLFQLESKLEMSMKTVRAAILNRSIAESQHRVATEGAVCAVCMEGARAVVFSCGHQSCESCSKQLLSCPFCRSNITTRIKLHDG